jgi:hypothetical protein
MHDLPSPINSSIYAHICSFLLIMFILLILLIFHACLLFSYNIKSFKINTNVFYLDYNNNLEHLGTLNGVILNKDKGVVCSVRCGVL